MVFNIWFSIYGFQNMVFKIWFREYNILWDICFLVYKSIYIHDANNKAGDV